MCIRGDGGKTVTVHILLCIGRTVCYCNAVAVYCYVRMFLSLPKDFPILCQTCLGDNPYLRMVSLCQLLCVVYCITGAQLQQKTYRQTCILPYTRVYKHRSYRLHNGYVVCKIYDIHVSLNVCVCMCVCVCIKNKLGPQQ